MNNHRSPSLSLQNQSGAVLIVALVLLAVVTLFGVASMQSSSMEMKMIAATIERNKNFAAAEALLSKVEGELLAKNLKLTDLQSDVCTNDCFVPACTNGYCFDGEFDSSDLFKTDCEIATTAGSTERTYAWKTSAAWTDGSGKFQTRTVNTITGKFMVEFLCFVDNGADDGLDPFPVTEAKGVPLFRISALVEADRAPVMVQSTWAPANF